MNRLSRFAVVALYTLVPSLVFAQDKITSALNQGSKWFSTITLAIGGIGLACPMPSAIVTAHAC